MVLRELQRWLVERVNDYFSRARVKFEFRADESAYQTVHNILGAAKTLGKEGQVAQYLVGAKLAGLRAGVGASVAYLAKNLLKKGGTP